MISFFIAGTILGFSAGIAPGPLLALVISETMDHGVRSGVKIALAPILTDLPIIFITLVILAKLSHFQYILGIISIIGGFFILYLGIESIRTKGINLNLKKSASKSLQKGIIVNILSPHPYLFWFSVGGPTTIKAMDINLFANLFYFEFLCSACRVKNYSGYSGRQVPLFPVREQIYIHHAIVRFYITFIKRVSFP